MQFVDFKADARRHLAAYSQAYKRVLLSGSYILSSEVESFEKEFAKYLGVKHVVGVGNGLDALHISLMSLGIKSGDEVITTPLSAVATTLAIISVGATPVFVDVGPDGQIDASQIETHITTHTKAIIPVHLYGNSCDIATIVKIAQKHNLKIIEDAAQAHGSSFQGQKLGTFGTLGCFSFYPTKNLGTIGGDAGAVATNDDNLAKSMRQLRNYGEASKYNTIRYGLNSRLDEFHAAILRTKLTWLAKSNIHKRKIAQYYLSHLSNISQLQLITPIPSALPNIHQFVVTTAKRDELQQFLASANIPSLIHYPTPIHQQPFLAKTYSDLSLPVAEQFCATTLSLPSHEFLTLNEQKIVVTKIKQFFEA